MMTNKGIVRQNNASTMAGVGIGKCLSRTPTHESILPESTFVLQALTGLVADWSRIDSSGGLDNGRHHRARRYREDTSQSAQTENEPGTWVERRAVRNLVRMLHGLSVSVIRVLLPQTGSERQYKLSGHHFSIPFCLGIGELCLQPKLHQTAILTKYI